MRFLIASWDGGGNTPPAFNLGSRLVRRGHHVRMLGWEPMAARASAAGLLPEQVNPFTGGPLSVAPLAWSHAAYVDVCLGYCQALEALRADAGEEAERVAG